ncbi:MAG TPA: hypothetical protein DDX40_05275 [Rikenellaceae bacterium]|nr:hypothetical protein [Rikenellaceae bacterium]
MRWIIIGVERQAQRKFNTGSESFFLPCFLFDGRCDLDKPLPARNMLQIHFVMKNIIIQISVDERLCIDCKDVAHMVFVRGHFRMVNGKKYYVKAHYRKK